MISMFLCVSLFVPLRVLCVFVCVISNESTSKNPYHLSKTFSELDRLIQGKAKKETGEWVLWYF